MPLLFCKELVDMCNTFQFFIIKNGRGYGNNPSLWRGLLEYKGKDRYTNFYVFSPSFLAEGTFTRVRDKILCFQSLIFR